VTEEIHEKTSARIANSLAEIQIQYLPNKSTALLLHQPAQSEYAEKYINKVRIVRVIWPKITFAQ